MRERVAKYSRLFSFGRSVLYHCVMDTITQIALGVCIGQAIGCRKLGAKAAVFGGLGGLIPDLDVFVTPFLGEYASWKFHRHITHALWFGPVLGSIMGWGLWRYYGRQAEHLRIWIWIMVLALFTHPLLDFCTIYGTQLLAPFSDKRFAISSVSIIDPIYTVPLFIALLFMAIKSLRQYAVKVSVIALAFTTFYLAFGWGLNFRAEQLAENQLQAQGIPYQRVTAYTTIFQPFLRRIVVDDGEIYRVGFVSTYNLQEIKWSCAPHTENVVMHKIMQDENAKVLNWFAMGEVALIQDKTRPEIYHLSDMRYGVPGESVFGWWGQSFRVNEDSVFYIDKLRVSRDSSWENITQLFRAAYGLDNHFLLSRDEGC